jgi:hypothetical protein
MGTRLASGQDFVMVYNQAILALCASVHAIQNIAQYFPGRRREKWTQSFITGFINVTTVLIMIEAGYIVWQSAAQGPAIAYTVFSTVLWVLCLWGQLDVPERDPQNDGGLGHRLWGRLQGIRGHLFAMGSAGPR